MGLSSPSTDSTVAATHTVPYNFVMGGRLLYHSAGEFAAG